MGDEKIVNLDLLVKDNIRILHLPVKRFTRPFAIILVGGPFTGKTELVKYLAKQLPLTLLSESDMAAFLAPRATFFKRGTEEIFLLASKTIEELVKQGYCCIYDASVKKYSDRELLRNLITKAGGSMILIHLILEESEAYNRLEAINAQIVRGDRKGFIMDKDFFSYERNMIEKPTSSENPITYNSQQAGEQLKIERQLRSMLGAPIAT